MDEFVTHQATITYTVNSSRQLLHWLDAICKNVIRRRKYTGSRQLRNVNESETSTGETKSY